MPSTPTPAILATTRAVLDGTLHANPTWDTGRFPGSTSLNFHGTFHTTVEIGSGGGTAYTTTSGARNAFRQLNEQLTVACWANTTVASNASLIWISNTNANSLWRLLNIHPCYPGGYGYFDTGNSSTTSDNPVGAGGYDRIQFTLPADCLSGNSWHFYVCTKDITSATPLRVYIDGAEITTGLTPTLHSPPMNMKNWNVNGIWIGFQPESPTTYSGLIDEVVILKRAMTAAEVLQMYQSETP